MRHKMFRSHVFFTVVVVVVFFYFYCVGLLKIIDCCRYWAIHYVQKRQKATHNKSIKYNIVYQTKTESERDRWQE